MRSKIILIVMVIFFALIAGCSRKPVSTTPAGTGSPATSGAQPTSVFVQGTTPTIENSITIACQIAFENGAQPEPYRGPGAEPQLYEFKNLKVVVTLKGESAEFAALIRKDKEAFRLGTTVAVAGNARNYEKLDRIVLRAAGYKDVEFIDVPINNGFVNLPNVVMMK